MSYKTLNNLLGINMSFNRHANEIPSKKLMEFIEADIDIYSYCQYLKTPLLITDIFEVFPSLEKF